MDVLANLYQSFELISNLLWIFIYKWRFDNLESFDICAYQGVLIFWKILCIIRLMVPKVSQRRVELFSTKWKSLLVKTKIMNVRNNSTEFHLLIRKKTLVSLSIRWLYSVLIEFMAYRCSKTFLFVRSTVPR